MKKLCLFLSILVALVVIQPAINQSYAAVDTTHPGFRVEGRFLYDNTGEKVILYGVNKMCIWMDKDGVPTFSEIAKTGANCVRITWGIDGTAEELDTVIRNCRSEHMIPIVELHDATGDWSKLPTLVNYWVRPDIVNVIKKHQDYLLVNVGNEVGQDVAESAFKADYEASVKKMREAGIHVPLIIDASSYGQSIDMLQACGPYLISADPDKNLMFSVHMWWPYMWGHTDQQVIDELTQSVNMNLPLIVGEFGHKWDETENGKIPYKTIMEYCYKDQIGYLPWEWGPGNNPQTFLDMTADSTFATLNDYGKEVMLNNQYSVKNIAKRPASMLTNLPPALPQEPLPYGNLAYNKPVTASSSESTQNSANNIVDGDFGTRWASQVSDPGWVYVDLGAKKEINRLIICWEAAYATQYKIQVSDDTNTWTDVITQYNGTGKTEDISLSCSGRYLRIYGMARYNYQWPYSIWEIGVYGPESELSASISPSVAVFDKNPLKRADIPVTLSPKSNTLDAVTDGIHTLVPDKDYTLSGNDLLIKKEYLSSLPIGTTKLILDFSGGVDPVFAVAVGDTTSPTAGIYGDANGDNTVDALDYAVLKQYLLGMTTLSDNALKLLDLNKDNTIDAIDLSVFKQYILGKVASLPIA
jgi:mannan endo-1,4-beta-mannosidase